MQGESQQSPELGPNSSGDTSSTDMSPSAVEGMLLMALEKLYKEDRELDVQMGLLRVVLQVLQRHGPPPQPPSPLAPPLPSLSLCPSCDAFDVIMLHMSTTVLSCTDKLQWVVLQHHGLPTLYPPQFPTPSVVP